MSKPPRSKARAVRFSPEEDAAIAAFLEESGMGFSTMLRSCVRIAFAVPTEEEANLRGFGEAISQLGRTGNNLNQLTRRVNRGQVSLSMEDSAVLRESLEAVTALRGAFETYQRLAQARDLGSTIAEIET